MTTLFTVTAAPPSMTCAAISEEPPPSPSGEERVSSNGETKTTYSVGTFVWGVDSSGRKFEGVVRRAVGSRGLKVEIHDKITVQLSEVIGSVESSPELVDVLRKVWAHEERHARAMAAAKRRATPKRR